MRSNHAIENSQNGSTVHATSPIYLPTQERGIEIRIQNLDKLVYSVYAAVDRESFEGKRHALEAIANLRVKIKATLNMFRLARLLSEPARESMLARVRDSVGGLENDIAAQLHVELT